MKFVKKPLDLNVCSVSAYYFKSQYSSHLKCSQHKGTIFVKSITTEKRRSAPAVRFYGSCCALDWSSQVKKRSFEGTQWTRYRKPTSCEYTINLFSDPVFDITNTLQANGGDGLGARNPMNHFDTLTLCRMHDPVLTRYFSSFLLWTLIKHYKS